MAVKHLQKIHNVGSPNTGTAIVKKRKHDHDYSHLSLSVLYSNNPTWLRVLMTTLMIINHNLAFRVVEYEEARLMQALHYKDEIKATITTKQVKEAIVELFWTCKTTQDKFLGFRVYLVDKAWQFQSILLGTRKFNPAHGDRDGGIEKPFKGWLKHMLENFSLATTDIYGATSDSGGDVKAMLCKELNLQWEWCFAHMTHAATKSSCGVNGAARAAANPAMAHLISRMVRPIFQVKVVSVTGNLFVELCKSKTKGASTRLLGYSMSRFMSLTRSLERVLEKWPVITAWCDERTRKALRASQPPPEFLLANRHDDLVHVLSG
ncbi:unnamed protein product [Phytophthora fragariaefolia]|uniref:Unnamed protein product n=1 Tax=Phytophthora fragariaefolia TaxID=1490495 RepID=A0A9W7CJ43_9STRA|nr:unnamed protein product [Phytophthora fragariaefolia]